MYTSQAVLSKCGGRGGYCWVTFGVTVTPLGDYWRTQTHVH